MFGWLRLNPAERRLLPEGRLGGPMPWVIAIMMFLTVLASAAGLATASAARQLGADLEGRLTIQLVEPDAATREREVAALLRELARFANVSDVARVSPAALAQLLAPWLGSEGANAGLPMPALIDLSLARATPDDVAAIRSAVVAIAPSARVDAHAQWLAPLAGLLGALQYLAAALVLLMAAATAAAVVMAARAALDTNRATIEILHLLGATDVQVAHLFQRRIALDALFGGTIGLIGAALVVLLLGQRAAGLGSELLGSVSLGGGQWLVLLLLPLAGTALAMLAARLTITRALGKTL